MGQKERERSMIIPGILFVWFGLVFFFPQNLPGGTLVMPFVETGNSGGGMVKGEGSQNMLHGNPQVQKANILFILENITRALKNMNCCF